MEVVIGDGCGNRFALVNHEDLLAESLTPNLVLHQCRDLDIDGLLVLDGSNVSIFNIDGTDGGVCYNGLRLVAMASEFAQGEFVMGGFEVSWERKGDQIELRLPFTFENFTFTDLKIDGVDVVKVDFANPHVVVKDFSGYFQDFAEKLQADVKHFPDSVNVEFVESFSAEGLVSARIFERGVGETMACGSGALVLAVDAWRTGFEGEICVKTWGGELYLSQVSLNSILLRGEARVTGKVRLELA
jgi:diaminopimelate epimerase